ncbi:hypothetical protein CFP65_0342 [Kitasatospora sp. MMS16-BH015]|uniref:ATP-binding protein n=1 Tax=Kitasatospora sp. MMS16-BH015 TaxID=2018025 RepID=UPI000CA1176F|nr:ATP-binding protein [Kitasatospora sp. MMS16-BH015]AUG75314.1 hypothetical protein CFP65_0342 [Kitasatospora sp. MMS16-BH015]
MPEPSTRFDLPVTTAGQARSAITTLLDRVPGDTRAVRVDAHLVATELVTNALRHGGGVTGFRTWLTADATVLCIEVQDAADRRPQEPAPEDRGPDRLGGRGWTIVLSLAATCVVRPLPARGKCIAVTLPVR